MNTSLENLTHKMQRAAVGKMVDVVLSHADKDRQKTVGQLVDVAKQFYGSSFSAEAYEHARQTLTDPDSKWSKLINCVLDQTDPNVARTMALNLGYGLPDFGYYTLYRTIFVLLLYIPVLTMRSFAEERHSRTDQLLLTSPVSVGGIVLGKYFALCVIFALPCLVDAGMILVLKVLGATGTSTLANFSALLCYYLMGCAAIAIGVFLSSLTENQIIAAVSGVAALLLAYMMPSLRTMFTTGSAVALALFTAIAAVLSVAAGLRSKSFTLGCLSFAGCCVALTALFLLKSSWLTEAFSAVLSALCLFTPFEEFVNSSFSIPTLVYYLTVAAVFLVFTAQGLEKRRWN